jgi:DNA-binding NarL/FixJ family response regulator
MTTPRIRVLIADDHEMVRRGLSLFLSSYDDLELIGEAADGVAALAQCKALQPDVVIADIMLPKLDGIQLITQIQQCCPAVRTIALTSFHDADLVRRALQAGALGFIYKDIGVDELAAAVRQVYAGKPALSPDAAHTIVSMVAGGLGRIEAVQLTERERRILELISAGYTNNAIAAELHFSVATVKQAIGGILVKLGAQTRTEAVTLALQQGLITL